MTRGPYKHLRFVRRSLRNHPGIYIVVILASLAIVFVAGFSGTSRRSSIRNRGTGDFDVVQEPFLDPFSGLASLPLPHRQIFPYSIVPGGVTSPQELKEAVAHDPIVAKHYSVLEVKKLRLIRLEKARMAYVSYRVGSKIFWTKRKLKLARGESLLTDGKNTLRTRCGNLVSESPRLPTLPAEPTSTRFDTPLIPEPPTNPVPPVALSPGPGGSIFFPPFVPIFPGGGPSPPNHPLVPPAAPVSIAEPSTIVLLVSGLALFWAISKFRPTS